MNNADWFDSQACKSRAFCQSCRTDAEWRETLFVVDRVPRRDFECPFGITAESLSNPDGLGTKIERLVAPVAKRLGLPCYGEDGKLKRESGCAKRRERLNALTAEKKTDS